ncbi:MAG: cryptochrome/photolyase family protein [Candidatus Puniceispirillales bacterium]
MTAIRLILGDQLTRDLAALRDLAPGDTVVMAEVADEAGYANHHKKKLVFVFSAMRHFAENLRAEGIKVDYTRMDDPENTGSIEGELARAVAAISPDRIITTEPGEYRLLAIMKTWQDRFGIPVEIRADDRFMTSRDEFSTWAEGRKSLRMEFFYREARRRYKILMEGDQPCGGQWNFDSENRQPPAEGITPPARFQSPPDAITEEVIAMVADRFSDHFGVIDGFHFATTRHDALAALDLFIDERLADFGTWQDAMVDGEPWMYHAHIGLYLNAGLLTPREVIAAAEDAFHRGDAPINAVEGFIRQILGWREYVRGIYWLTMPDYAAKNELDAHRPLPDFYWTAETEMRCLAECVRETSDNAYAHHIQRLMVLGNFALLAGIDPKEVNAWFLGVYADAYEWVEMPNVSGMTLYADGGYLASKPYAASGAYINRMSTYCRQCRYKVARKNGPEACPFNYLYWDFLIRNSEKLSGNPRMGMPYRTLAKMTPEKINMIQEDSQQFFHEQGLDK